MDCNVIPSVKQRNAQLRFLHLRNNCISSTSIISILLGEASLITVSQVRCQQSNPAPPQRISLAPIDQTNSNSIQFCPPKMQSHAVNVEQVLPEDTPISRRYARWRSCSCYVLLRWSATNICHCTSCTNVHTSESNQSSRRLEDDYRSRPFLILGQAN